MVVQMQMLQTQKPLVCVDKKKNKEHRSSLLEIVSDDDPTKWHFLPSYGSLPTM